MTEEEVYDAQEEYIKDHFGVDVHKRANYGWAVDEVERVICTKVYGYGILITDFEGNHTFEYRR